MKRVVKKDELGWLLAQGWTFVDRTKDGEYIIEDLDGAGSSFVCEQRDWKSPNWEHVGRIHDWRNYIDEEVQSMWDTFTDDQKQALQRQAQEEADCELWD